MSRCSFATWRPLPENSYQPWINPTQVILHSAVDAPGPTTLYGFFARADVTVESHFFVKLDGRIEQYMDTNRRADANRWANIRAISIETEDDGNPDQRRWTPAQVASILRLLRWAHEVHGIPLRVCPAWNQPGVGYHSMWGAPGPWTPTRGKTCPGTIRIAQFKSEIVPALTASTPAPPPPKGFLMALSDKQQQEVYDFIKVLRDGVPAFGVPPLPSAYSEIVYSLAGVDLEDGKKVSLRNALAKKIDDIPAAVAKKVPAGAGASADQIKQAVAEVLDAELGFLKPGQ